MHPNMLHNAVRAALFAGLTAALAACGGGSGGSGSAASIAGTMNEATMPLSLSDASSQDWSTIGVRVLSIALVPQSGGGNLTLWSAASPAPYVNLEQLD